jgi:hypothetical protein
MKDLHVGYFVLVAAAVLIDFQIVSWLLDFGLPSWTRWWCFLMVGMAEAVTAVLLITFFRNFFRTLRGAR